MQIHYQMCWIVFVNVAHIGDTWEGGISIETASILLAHELVWEGIFLIAKLMEKGPVHCEWYLPYTGGPGLSKKDRWM